MEEKITIKQNKHGVCRTEKDSKYPRVFVDFAGLGFENFNADLKFKDTPEFQARSIMDFMLRKVKGSLAPIDAIARQAIESIGLPQDTRYYWDDYAGCDMCPCSGAVVLEHEHTHDYRAIVHTVNDKNKVFLDDLRSMQDKHIKQGLN